MDHRGYADVELAIRNFKHGAGLNYFPAWNCSANAAWLIATCLAHNLACWIQLLGIITPMAVVGKTLRRPDPLIYRSLITP